jgi:adenylate cyclase
MEKETLAYQEEPIPAEEPTTVTTRLPFLSQLRFKVIVPYLALALLLAIAGTFFLARVFAERLQERLLSQLWQAGHYASDEVVYVERELLTTLRGIAHTQGVAEAVASGDEIRLHDLIYPLAANAGADCVEITTLDGKGILSLHRDTTSEASLQYVVAWGRAYQDWDLIEKVAVGRVDDIGDKFAGLVDSHWGRVFYISGPIKRETGEPVGVVLVGMTLPRLVYRMAGRPLYTSSNRDTGWPLFRQISLYDSNGQAVFTTFDDIPTQTLQISPEVYMEVLEGQEYRYLERSLEWEQEEFKEAFGSFEARHGADLAVFSVALPGYQEEQVVTQIVMVLVFSLAVVAIVLIGIWVSAQIIRPIRELVLAAGRVARGDLSHKVVLRTEDEIGLLAYSFNRMIQGLRVKEFIRDAFGRFVSRDVSEALLRGNIRLQGEKRVVSMLFADIRDFTRLSEQYDPVVMVNILNEYFTAMVDLAKVYGGTVNKFGGDSTLVVFGAPVFHEDHADRAVQTALGMRRRLAQLNAERLTRGEVPIRMGIGINTGEVVAGTVGSADRMEYTVIGDSVNLSARIQGLNKEYPEYDILISEYTYDYLTAQQQYTIRSLGPITLKGKSESVRIFAVEGVAEAFDGAEPEEGP